MTSPLTNISLGPTLTAEQARQIFAQGEEAVVFALLQMAQLVAMQSQNVFEKVLLY